MGGGNMDQEQNKKQNRKVTLFACLLSFLSIGLLVFGFTLVSSDKVVMLQSISNLSSRFNQALDSDSLLLDKISSSNNVGIRLNMNTNYQDSTSTLLLDYLENKEGIENIETSLKRVKNANLNALLPETLNINLKEGLLLMNNKINGFTSNATLLGVESRSSAPIRFYRDENMESNIKGIYPIGEGAGYAGGIMSSAIDGLKCSEVLLKGER